MSPAVAYTPGDILLVKNYRDSKISDLIMAGERSRYGDTEYAQWTHTALITTPNGDLIEALSEGIRTTHITKYAQYKTHTITPPIDIQPRLHAIKAAQHFAEQHDQYDYLDFIGLALQALLGWNVSLHNDQRFICSGLVARACDSYVTAWPHSSENMTPADLAAVYNVHADLPPQPHSWFSRLLDKLRGLTRKLADAPNTT